MTSIAPPWLRKKAPQPGVIEGMGRRLSQWGVHTVCQAAGCPNQGECFAAGTATFLILGDTCTRSCRFCGMKPGHPPPPDSQEPLRVARAVQALNLSYAVITSVSRDDLSDGGAAHFAATAAAIREVAPATAIEFLIPDFTGQALKTALAAPPQVLGHNIETVPRLYPRVRPQADYRRSLKVLRQARELSPRLLTKSGLMLGLGETPGEVEQTMEELRGVGCELLTIGQYLAPSPQHHPVRRYVPPEEFAQYEALARELGFKAVASAPFVRSSWGAAAMFGEAGNTPAVPPPPARGGYQSPGRHRASP